jgi:hypothetical protein
MREVLQAIQTNTVAHQRHALFQLLGDAGIDAERRLAFSPSAAHYVLTFRDFCQHVNAQIDREAERARWFIADLAQLGYDPRLPFSDALELVRSSESARSHTLSYRFCRLTLGANSLEKLALVHCIAATASLTVNHVMGAARGWAAATGQSLASLGVTHDDARESHGLSAEEVALLEDIRLPAGVRRELSHLVERAFEYFAAFADELLAASRLAVPAVERSETYLSPLQRPRVITQIRELRGWSRSPTRP